MNPLQKQSSVLYGGQASTSGAAAPAASDASKKSKIDEIGRTLIGSKELDDRDITQFFESLLSIKNLKIKHFDSIYSQLRHSEIGARIRQLNFSGSFIKLLLNSDYESEKIIDLVKNIFSNDSRDGFHSNFYSNFCLNNLDFLAHLKDKTTLRLFFENAAQQEKGFYKTILPHCRETHPELLLRFYEFSPTPYSLEDRLTFAEKAAESTTLAEKILLLFGNHEIVEHHDRIMQLFNRSKAHCTQRQILSYLDKTKLYLEYLAVASATPSRPASSNEDLRDTKMPEVYELIKKFTNANGDGFRVFRLTDEYYSECKNYRKHARGKDNADLSISAKNEELFPATVAPPTAIKSFMQLSIASALGFNFEDSKTGNNAVEAPYARLPEGNGTYVTLPEPATLVKKWNQMRARAKQWVKLNPQESDKSLPKLKIKMVDHVVTPEEFNRAFAKGKIIVDMKGEFFHDMTRHIMPNIFCILNTGRSIYENCLNLATTSHTNASQAIAFARTDSSNTESPEMLNILATTTGIFADIFTAISTIAERNNYIKEAFGYDVATGVQRYDTISMPKTEWLDKGWIKKFEEDLPGLKSRLNANGFTPDEINAAWIRVLQNYAARS